MQKIHLDVRFWLAVVLATAAIAGYVDALAHLFDQFGRFNPGEAAFLNVVVVVLAVFGVGAALLGVWIYWRTADRAPARQVAWMLIVYSCFGFWLVVMPILAVFTPRYDAFTDLIGDFMGLVAAMLVVYLGVALARFLVIFPRPVDTDSVHTTFFSWRWSRLLMRDHGQRSFFLRPWHRHLVSGRILWAAPLAVCIQYLFFVAWDRFFYSGGVAGGLWFVLISLAAAFYFAAALPYAFASLVHVYHFGSKIERQQVSALRAAILAIAVFYLFVTTVAILLGTVLALTGNRAFFRVVGVIAGICWAFSPLILTVTASVAVLQGGALDARVAFTRISLWSVLTVTVTLAFILLERWAAVKMVQWFQLSSDTAAVAVGAMIATSIVPVHNVSNRWLTRLAVRWIPVEMLADGERQEGAVAIVDMSGYTALSARDESAAMLQSAVLRRCADRAIEADGGRLVKSLGDAVMLIFPTAAQAVAVVKAIHANFPGVAQAVVSDPLALHSSIHFGEVVVMNDGDIFGQTVNVTARMVDVATAGQIVVSDAVLNALVPDTPRESVGERRFKNVPVPIACFKL